MCSRAGLPCCTLSRTGHGSCLLLGMIAGVRSQVCSEGCPGLSFRAGSLRSWGLCAGTGTLLPARVSTQPARGAPHSAAKRICGWKQQPQAGQGPPAVRRVLRGSGLLRAPGRSQDISGADFSRGRSRQGLAEKEGTFQSLLFPALVG